MSLPLAEARAVAVAVTVAIAIAVSVARVALGRAVAKAITRIEADDETISGGTIRKSRLAESQAHRNEGTV